MYEEKDMAQRIIERRLARQKRNRRRRAIRIAIAVIIAVVLVATPLIVHLIKSPVQSVDSPNVSEQTTETTTIEKPTEPYVQSTASIGVTGDILIHKPILENAKTADGYNFDNIFTLVNPYFSSYDLMIANLEITLGGKDKGYSAYPMFNSPDEVVDSLKKSGVDMVLTANNHTYDTGLSGMKRTLEVLENKDVDYIGTRRTDDGATYKVCDVNGIKIGMACYTYETPTSTAGRKALNGLLLNAEAGPLVNSFNYNNLSSFYSQAEASIKAMKDSGADAIVFYMHWGNEYQFTPDNYQKSMAQKLCDLGVDVIVGGHPHVVQPFDTLTSENGHETVCIYSMGNAVSNQRKEIMDPCKTGHTEDGMIFTFSFEKWNDGTVKISDVNIIPTWVNLKTVNGKKVYEITPLDIEKGGFSDRGKESYNRTMKLVGEPLNEYRTAHGMSKIQTTV